MMTGDDAVTLFTALLGGIGGGGAISFTMLKYKVKLLQDKQKELEKENKFLRDEVQKNNEKITGVEKLLTERIYEISLNVTETNVLVKQLLSHKN